MIRPQKPFRWSFPINCFYHKSKELRDYINNTTHQTSKTKRPQKPPRWSYPTNSFYRKPTELQLQPTNPRKRYDHKSPPGGHILPTVFLSQIQRTSRLDWWRNPLKPQNDTTTKAPQVVVSHQLFLSHIQRTSRLDWWRNPLKLENDMTTKASQVSHQRFLSQTQRTSRLDWRRNPLKSSKTIWPQKPPRWSYPTNCFYRKPKELRNWIDDTTH